MQKKKYYFFENMFLLFLMLCLTKTHFLLNKIVKIGLRACFPNTPLSQKFLYKKTENQTKSYLSNLNLIKSSLPEIFGLTIKQIKNH
jgi:hypothetical protein